ncbi:MAG: hypothetical protein OEV49_11765 [candidate division Zixibacteria bacterium]|nr:hypothetical protein [candidate division Zixibacteria bacterium]MDH3936006.1 hypothetical protein [candidate division Zixibacteria bacterium]MDH4033972.1 hypothetical protein [candidate division Zixibacteria bacterium]
MKRVPLFLCLALICVGCASQTYHLIKPIEPKPKAAAGSPYWPTKVSSLQPQFRWEGNADQSYDLIIYEVVMVDGAGPLMDKVPSPGAEVFYEEGIVGTSFVLPNPLRPDTDYLWSVRSRSSTEVSDWATYDTKVGQGIYGPGKSYYKVHFWIKTPD